MVQGKGARIVEQACREILELPYTGSSESHEVKASQNKGAV